MSSNTTKKWSWKKILGISFIGIILIVIIGYCALLLVVNSYMHSYLKPRVYTFHTVEEMDKQLKESVEGNLTRGLTEEDLTRGYSEVRIPKSATDIYIFYRGGRDLGLFFSLKLPASEVSKFAEGFARVPISQFKEGKTSQRYYTNDGPAGYGKRWKTPYWDLEKIKRGKFYETVGKYEVEGKEYVGGGGRFIVIDLDTNRIYICVWST